MQNLTAQPQLWLSVLPQKTTKAGTAAMAVCLLLSSCSWSPTRNGGNSGGYTPSAIDDAEAGNIPDAVPRVEARSRRGNPAEYKVFGKKYRVWSDKRAAGYKESGKASWYGTKFHGRLTSSGERYDMMQMTAAHKHLPIPCYVRVTHRNNGRSIIVKVNDRGPFVGKRIIDLSYAAATKLGMRQEGVAEVTVSLIDPHNYQPTSANNSNQPAQSYQTRPSYTSDSFQASAAQNSSLDKIPMAKTWPTTQAESLALENSAALPTSGNSIGDIRSLPGSTVVSPGSVNGAYDGGYNNVYVAPNNTTEGYRYDQAIEEQAFEAQTQIAGVANNNNNSKVEEVAFSQPMALPPPPLSTIVTSGGFYVQIATFRNNNYAIRMAKKLSSENFEPVRLVPGRMRGTAVQQVRVGPLNSVDEAERFRQQLSQAGYQGTFVIREVTAPR